MILKTSFSMLVGISAITLLLSCNQNKPEKDASQPAGSGSAAGELDRTILPIKEPYYPAQTELDVRKATAPARFEVTAPKGAPNVLVILIDDQGFGVSSAFGGPVQEPVLDKMASNGLRYNNFNTTALCSPTRTAINRLQSPQQQCRQSWKWLLLFQVTPVCGRKPLHQWRKCFARMVTVQQRLVNIMKRLPGKDRFQDRMTDGQYIQDLINFTDFWEAKPTSRHQKY